MKLHPEEPFDLVFIDADKRLANALYFAEAKRLVRKGGVIVRPPFDRFSAIIEAFTD